MKRSYSTLLGLLALAAGGVSHAQIVIRFSASNGDRNATQVAISRILTDWKYQGLNGGYTGQTNIPPEQQPSSDIFRTSNFGTWNGTWNGKQVIIKTNYAGALAGLQSVANQATQVRFDTSDGTGTAAVAHPLDTETFELGTVDFGLSTNFQSTSPYQGDYNGVTYNTLHEIPVGISQLGFYASPGFPDEVDNITTQQARLLYDSGIIPLALLTGKWTGDDGAEGNTGDSRKYVFAVGRNTDAGQRFASQQEIGRSGIGFQWAWQPWNSAENPAPLPGGAANAPLIETSPGVWEQNTNHEPEKSFVIGNSQRIGGLVTNHRLWANGEDQLHSGIWASGGHNSGANLAIALTYKISLDAVKASTGDPGALGGWYVGYITPGDANATLLGVGQGAARPNDTKGKALKFNGVENTPSNVKNGTYTLWLYNRIVAPLPVSGGGDFSGVADKEDPGETPGFRAAFVEALANRIKLEVATQQGISLSDPDLKVYRSEDGGSVFPGTL